MPQVSPDARANARSSYHPVGTCKMGSDPMAVVDDCLRVHGVERLRVNSGATAVEFVTDPIEIMVALSDETTDITTGTAKLTIRAPCAFTLTAVRANLNTVSSSGTPTVDINVNGSTILSTKLTIDASEKTSVTAATAAVISSGTIADDDEITFDIDTAGTGAKGLKVTLIGTRS